MNNRLFSLEITPSSYMRLLKRNSVSRSDVVTTIIIGAVIPGFSVDRGHVFDAQHLSRHLTCFVTPCSTSHGNACNSWKTRKGSKMGKYMYSGIQVFAAFSDVKRVEAIPHVFNDALIQTFIPSIWLHLPALPPVQALFPNSATMHVIESSGSHWVSGSLHRRYCTPSSNGRFVTCTTMSLCENHICRYYTVSTT